MDRRFEYEVSNMLDLVAYEHVAVVPMWKFTRW